MRTLILDDIRSGIHLSADELRKAGFTPGDLIEIVRLPDGEAIADQALSHVLRFLGEGLGVADPVWTDTEWQVDVLAPSGVETLGRLYLDVRGSVDLKRSLSYEELLEITTRTNDSSPERGE